MMKSEAMMTKAELEALTNQEVQKLWNELSLIFNAIKTNRPNNVVVGFFQLSRETERRGLQLGKDRAGKIILEPKTQPVYGCRKLDTAR